MLTHFTQKLADDIVLVVCNSELFLTEEQEHLLGFGMWGDLVKKEVKFNFETPWHTLFYSLTETQLAAFIAKGRREEIFSVWRLTSKTYGYFSAVQNLEEYLDRKARDFWKMIEERR